MNSRLTWRTFGSGPRLLWKGCGLICNRLRKLNHVNECYIYNFFSYCYYCRTVCNSKSLYFFVLFQKYIYFWKNWKYIFLKKLNKADTSLYFLTLENVSVSLPTKCLSDPTSGLVLIGNYRLGLPRTEMCSHQPYFQHQLFLKNNICFFILEDLFQTTSKYEVIHIIL